MTTVQIFALIIWVIIIVASFIVEAVTEELVSIWFTVAAILSLILDIFGVNIYVQIIIFIVVSVILLVVLRDVLKKFNKEQNVPTNLDRAIGQIGVAITDIDPSDKGEVRVNFQNWTAISKVFIKKDEKVVIVNIEGNKLIVDKIENYEVK